MVYLKQCITICGKCGEHKMKRAIVIIASLCMLSIVAYGTYATQSHASNNPENEEYYYNEDDWERIEGMIDSSVSSEQKAGGAFVDTTKDSTTVLINKEFALPADYVPENLVVPSVPFSFSGYKEKKLLREDAAKALEELFKASEEAQLSLFAVSGYRSYDRQKAIYDSNVARSGSER
ncbi:MAG: D-alanyl-D-alanine carboxypeptidase family protein, partial [Acetivibrio ethanolgignens]